MNRIKKKQPYPFTEINGLELKKIVVPEYVFWKEHAELECRYNLQKNEKLYRVQWYKDNDEFYRFDQKSVPRQFSYPNVDSIKVNLSQSNENKVVLKNVNLMMRGMYKCEVSAEAPNFITVYGESRMEVIALPKEGPHIKGEKETYQIGDTINLTCTSGKSHPATKLKWFINDKEILSDNEINGKPGDLMISRTNVSLKALPDYFINNHIQIRCQAIISVENHNVITLPIQRNSTPTHSSTKFGYQNDALISGTLHESAKYLIQRLETDFLIFLQCYCEKES
ncbi:hypothetical protein PGB90_007271 [Kerria lacca]